MSTAGTPHVLSIQSHVVSGYVGNKCATFPLQLLGFEVDALNSVQLSNHTGYKKCTGQVLDDKDLDDLVSGLLENGLDNYTHLLTGYARSPLFLKRVASVVSTLKRKNPNLIYVCDPVLGDNGKLYVPEELIQIYKEDIVPLADVLTPNQFELALLTEKKVSTINEIQIAIKELHDKGPKIVAVTSTNIPGHGKLTAIVSSIRDNSLLKVDIPEIPVSFTGSGDLFAALFLAHLHLQDNFKTATEKTVNTLHGVLQRTFECCQALNDMNVQPAQKLELCLIQSKETIEHPQTHLIAETL